MIDMALRNLWQRKTRSVLTALGIASVVMLYLWSSTIIRWYDRDLQQQLSGMAGKVMVRATAEESNLYATTVIPESQALPLLSLDGVDSERSTPLLLETLKANPAPGMPPSVQAVGVLPGREKTFFGEARVEGSGDLRGSADVILGAQAAKELGKALGDGVEIRGNTFKVVGVLEPVYQVVDSAVLMALETAQTAFVRPGVISQVYLVSEQADRAEDLAKAVKTADPKLEAMTSGGMARAASAMLEGMKGFFSQIQGVSLAVAIIVITIVMNMAISERKREIGTLKAIGGGAGPIISMILVEAVVLSLIGAMIAIPVTWLSTNDGGNARLDWILAGQAVLAAALIGALAALWPAWSAVRVDPLESLRYE